MSDQLGDKYRAAEKMLSVTGDETLHGLNYNKRTRDNPTPTAYTDGMKKTASGFTIVELLIVVVIIAILATVSIVLYNGAQERARSSQTLSAVEQWMKILQSYKARNGSLPPMSSCLGSDYKYNSNGQGSAGVGQCRQDNGSYGIKSDPAFDSLLSNYVTSKPTPAMVTTTVSETDWRRGAYYYVNRSTTPWKSRIDFVLDSGQTCPQQLGGISRFSQTNRPDGRPVCVYMLGNTSSY